MGDFRPRNNKNKFKVYAHYCSDGLFYIGATSKTYRHRDAYGRHNAWKKRASNYWFSSVLIDNLSKEDASEIEELAIRTWGDLLSNQRGGGFSGYSFNHKQKTKDKLGRKVIDKSNGRIYASVTSCAKDIGITRSKLKHQLRGTVKNKTTIVYYEE